MKMDRFFINLKRFDIPEKYWGICHTENPQEWIENIIEKTVNFGLEKIDNIDLTYLLPEGLVLPALSRLNEFSSKKTRMINIGIQGVFREDTIKGGNFGAFTTNVPAAAVRNFGCTWVMNGHSEERKDKYDILISYDPAINTDKVLMEKASNAINSIINRENITALKRGLNVLYCIGETLEEKGKGSVEEQNKRVKTVLKNQIKTGLNGLEEALYGNDIVIGYEPRWAIGPGRVPPGEEYIRFVSEYIKECTKELFDLEIDVVYGGGLKQDNAKMISGIKTINGGLIALTRFNEDFNFEPEGLKEIIETYISK